MRIGTRQIGPGHPTYVVAEIGQNHNGDVYHAIRLIKAAVDAGADAVKFCKRYLPGEMTDDIANAPYNSQHAFGRTYGEHRAALELSADDFRHIKDRVRYNEWDIDVFGSVCHPVAVREIAEALEPPVWKVASRDLDNVPLLWELMRRPQPIILSTGMATLREIDVAAGVLANTTRHGCGQSDRVALLHCRSEYPTPTETVHLSRLRELRHTFGLNVGWSDHSEGVDIAPLAVAFGACIVEKHITLNKRQKGSDHAGSAEPDEFAEMVKRIRRAEQAVGDWGGEPFNSDASPATQTKLRRVWCATKPIRAGEPIWMRDLEMRTACGGLRGFELPLWREPGWVAAKDIKPGPIYPEMLANAKECHA